MPLSGALASEDRLKWLNERLSADGSVTIAAAAGVLGVSEMTIRRDLAELEERGVARRVRGGARVVGPQTFAERSGLAVRAKARIAAKLAPLVPETGAVAFDASSTVMRLASSVDAARDLIVLTNGLDTFMSLQRRPGVSPLLTGGRIDPRTGSLVGPFASRAASTVAVDRFFMSASAVDPSTGALEATLEEADVKRALATSAAEVVLAVDASKLEARAIAVGVPWEEIDLLVTELDPSDKRLDAFRSLVEIR